VRAHSNSECATIDLKTSRILATKQIALFERPSKDGVVIRPLVHRRKLNSNEWVMTVMKILKCYCAVIVLMGLALVSARPSYSEGPDGLSGTAFTGGPLGPNDLADFINSKKYPLAVARIAALRVQTKAELEKLLAPDSVPAVIMVLCEDGQEARHANAASLVFGNLATEYPGPTARFRVILCGENRDVVDSLFQRILQWAQAHNIQGHDDFGNNLSKPVVAIYKPARLGEPDDWSVFEEAKATAGFSQMLLEKWLGDFTGVLPVTIHSPELTDPKFTDEDRNELLFGQGNPGLELLLSYRKKDQPNGIRLQELVAIEGQMYDPKVLTTLQVNLDDPMGRAIFAAMLKIREVPDEPVVALLHLKRKIDPETGRVKITAKDVDNYTPTAGLPAAGLLTQWSLETWLEQIQKVVEPRDVQPKTPYLLAEQLQRFFSELRQPGVPTQASPR
jgi:hypothetical protein